MELSEQIFWLSKGIHPATECEMPEWSWTHEPEVKRYLSAIATELLELETDEISQPNSPARKKKNKAKKVKYRTISDKEREELIEKNLKEGRPKRSHFPWTKSEDDAVKAQFEAGKTIGEIAAIQERSAGAIGAKLQNLGLVSE